VVVRDQDDIYPVDQPFQEQKIVKRYTAPSRPSRIGPQPLH
jgi:hypothetical protein